MHPRMAYLQINGQSCIMVMNMTIADLMATQMAENENENGNDGGGLTGLGRLCRCCLPERGFPVRDKRINNDKNQ